MGAAGEHDQPELTRTAPGRASEPETIRKHSIRISGHATSISLENAFWSALEDLAAETSVTVAHLVREIDAGRRSNLSSAIRVFVLQHYRAGDAAEKTA